MQQSLIVVVVLMQIIIYLVADNLPVAQPKIIHKILIFIGTLAVVVFTFLDVDFYQMIMSLHPLVFFGVTTTLSVIPPLLGLLESKLKANGERIYSTGGMPGTTNRLPIHLLTNLAGALIVVLLAWVARRYATPSGIVSDWLVSGLAVNILLPLATMSTLAFVRLQQTRACPELDDRVKNGQPFAECIAGYSLRYLHQFSNVLYLIFVTFFGGATFLYVLATLIEGAYNDGNSSTASLASIIGVASAILGTVASAAWLALKSRIDVYISNRRDSNGLLDVERCLVSLGNCKPASFTLEEVRRRRKVIEQIEKVAVAVEGIPSVLKCSQPVIVRAAAERAAALRLLQADVTHMTAEEQSDISAALLETKRLYDRGRWWDLPTAEVETVAELSTLARALWSLVAVACFAGIVGVIIMTAMGIVPAAAAAPGPFILGVVLYGALSRLGLSNASMQQALDVTEKAQKGFLPKATSSPEGGKPS